MLDVESFGLETGGGTLLTQEAFEKLPDDEQALILDFIAGLLEENPLEGYNRPLSKKLHEKQVAFHSAKTRVKAAIAGNRSGKTFAGAADDLIQALPMDWVPEHLQPYKRWGIDEPFKCRIFTPKLNQTMEAVQEALRTLCPPSQFRGGTWDRAYAKADRILTFANGSQFDFFSYDQDLDVLGGVSRHRIHYDEEPPEAIRLASRKRIIDTGGDEVFTFTPELGISWTRDAIDERKDDPDFTVIHWGMADNPHISKKEIEAYTADLTDEQRRVALYGEYVSMGGIFYPEFSERLHVVRWPEEELRKRIQEQDVLCIIDPGLNRAGALWMIYDNENIGVAVNERIFKQATPDQQARIILGDHADLGIDPSKVRYVIDPAARNRATVNADNVEAAYARAEIYCEHGQNDRAAGILEVKRRLQKGQLFTHERCPTLIWEKKRYQRDPKSKNEFDAVKVNDELVDCERYGVMARTWHVPSPPESRPVHSDFTKEGPWRPAQRDAPPLGAFS